MKMGHCQILLATQITEQEATSCSYFSVLFLGETVKLKKKTMQSCFFFSSYLCKLNESSLTCASMNVLVNPVASFNSRKLKNLLRSPHSEIFKA